ncbi:N-6 DNA methylase [candidate division WOR-3 bacterium]|uniref:site-specific DNA-methyltransferase (adenine-specific) n=1 Tax=candidate division WOR-3 bacterium TaxID=2052148 RepID=A0A9D5QEW8_UNCW3|nr:N-6 DNA methylase [candidate division WOR-3 bacterium]MBD3365415.1 N-6 DNA methylase [candidate division WOR-3 bacterium]
MAETKKIKERVKLFEEHLEAYRSGRYKEEQLRLEFINPLFQALGWDVYNEQGFAEAYKDVVHEDSLPVGGGTKAPDYCFRIGGTRKFFVEAKKPSVDIKQDTHPAFQLRRYAWSAKLPLSILTDFEEFAVYDCRIKPIQTDKASAARIMYIEYKDYLDRWDEIASIFSKDAVLKGSFDRYVESTRLKRGTAEVDDAFLAEIECWRNELARNIALRNPKLSTRQLNFAVQKTIDRIIFLRICEDRGIEGYGKLQSLINGTNVYKRLTQLFRNADDRYNSGLFHFKDEKGRDEPPDDLTLNLKIDDDKLKLILKDLYYPDSPYEFSVLPADILGQVYEQFLGKVIRLTAGHRAKVEEKPEVRKAGGVYYTPTYIVDYIVANTVGKLCKGKTPAQVSKIRILDPACGSGSFLLGAYQYLLDWHRDYYIEEGAAKHKKKLYQVTDKEWRLTAEERKRILLNNIYGVDIDPQAVEVTKLSLLLKVLEGENEETLNRQMQMFHKRALPDLGSNIKCGNSLIGSDFYQGRQTGMFDAEEQYRINAFDWEVEFAEIMDAGGFDAVIGNPPYGTMINPRDQEYFSKTYCHQDYQRDFYLLFLELYERLLKDKGQLGVIISNTWLQSITLRRIREYLTSRFRWKCILPISEKVFSGVVDTHVLIFEKFKGGVTDKSSVNIDTMNREKSKLLHQLPGSFIPRNGDSINVIAPPEAQLLFRKILSACSPLTSICDVFNGVKPFEKGKGTPPQTEKVMKTKPYVKEGKVTGDQWTPLLRGSLIQRYRNLWHHNYWIQYGPWLAAPRDPSIFQAPLKIVVRQTGDSIIAVLVNDAFIARDNLHIILPKDSNHNLHYILGLINSKLMDFIYTFINPEKGEAFILRPSGAGHGVCVEIESLV